MEEYIQTHSSHLRQTPTGVGTSCDAEKSVDTSNNLPGKVWSTLTWLIEWVYYKSVLQLLLVSGMETYQKKRGNSRSSGNSQSQIVMLWLRPPKNCWLPLKSSVKIKVQLLKIRHSLVVYRVVLNTRPLVRKSTWNGPISLHFSLREGRKNKPENLWLSTQDRWCSLDFKKEAVCMGKEGNNFLSRQRNTAVELGQESQFRKRARNQCLWCKGRNFMSFSKVKLLNKPTFVQAF